MSERSYIIDFDSTLVTTESLDDLAQIALNHLDDASPTISQINQITNDGMCGKICFEEALTRRLDLFNPNKLMVDGLIKQLHAKVSPSATENQEWFRENAENIYVVSGGFEDYITPVVSRLGINAERVFANRFLYDSKDNIIGYDDTRPTARAGGKAEQIKRLNMIGRVVVIGDGYTDFEAKKCGTADEFWAFTETIHRDSVVAEADRVLSSFHELS